MIKSGPGFDRAGRLAIWLVVILLGGPVLAQATTNSRLSFSHLIAGLDSTFVAKFNYGRGIFEHQWSRSTHPDGTATGLGPFYNGVGCAQCHVRDGRGQPPGPDAPAISGFVMQLGVPVAANGPQTPDPRYGLQLQEQATAGVLPEGRITITYDDVPMQLGDTTVQLRSPNYEIVDLGYGPLAPDVRLGPRIAPPIFGLGFVAAIDADDIIANADEFDADGDGISGRANFVTDKASGALVLGRFGWKASAPSIRAQAERAAALDMGLSSPAHGDPDGDCMPGQGICEAEGSERPELDEQSVRLIEFYVSHLAIPASRDLQSIGAVAGREVFEAIGCAACHVPEFVTTGEDEVFKGKQIRPYSDFLLHDMGPDLADGITVGRASEAEWRTAPLWAIGLSAAVSGRETYLHDGRARTLSEAILWHGGEAAGARARFQGLSEGARQVLLEFIAAI
ncbi:di-heme oxidoredictase family protein [Devosia rhodophyticola]|uniref:Di-heme oxidoredictase family protein n=1 Tax=Devosia rhodophyticola TaxID=3026423 RepID=A0ABY7YSY7_9HYPH|nr:di-heme oxidoredictase family protein [Devosia rhodophyticola]WDR04424.1 di-heme oxidoredictase family protein [Devosia rhodophyticola]